MKKKGLLILGLLAMILMVTLGFKWLYPKAGVGEKNITLIFVDEMEHKTLKEVTIQSEATTLEDVLKEPEFEAVLTRGTFGVFIDGLLGLTTQDMNSGPWWTYASENNETCVMFSYCPAINEVSLQDGDRFTFTWTNRFD